MICYNNSNINSERNTQMSEKRDGYYSSVFGNDYSEEFYNIDDRFMVDVGYGEEPSYIFYLKKDGKVRKGIDIWEGFIEVIAELIPLENGRFVGLAYYINVGMFEDDHWHIDNVKMLYEQLRVVDLTALQAKDKEHFDAYSALLDFVKEMLESGNEIDVMKL